jgi:hypothetical protein
MHEMLSLDGLWVFKVYFTHARRLFLPNPSRQKTAVFGPFNLRLELPKSLNLQLELRFLGSLSNAKSLFVCNLAPFLTTAYKPLEHIKIDLLYTLTPIEFLYILFPIHTRIDYLQS